MALTKATLIDQMTDQLGFTRKQSTAVVELLLEIIKSALAAGDDVQVFSQPAGEDQRRVNIMEPSPAAQLLTKGYV